MTISRVQRVGVVRPQAASVAFTAGQRAVQERLSPAAAAFLEFVETHPRLVERRTFSGLEARLRSVIPHLLGIEGEYGLQPWPVLLSPSRWAEFARVAAGFARLVPTLPRRFFADDHEALARFYGLAGPELAALLLAPPDGLAETIARGDFLDGPEGLRLIEWNAGNLGSWQNPALSPVFAAEPEFSTFFAGGWRPGWIDTPRRLLRHAVAAARDLGLVGAQCNVLVLVGAPPYDEGGHPRAVYREALAETLADLAPGAVGKVVLARPEEVSYRAGGVTVGGRRMHAVVEQNDQINPPDLYRAFKIGEVALLTGPASLVVADKRNLALLSEHAASDRFTAEERALIEAHVPWTRRLVPGTTDWRGREVNLPAIVLAEREALVIKEGRSIGGAGVVVGAAEPPERWRAAVEAGLAAGSWIVQEAIDPPPYLFQAGEAGAVPHRVVWGLYAFGGEFAGVFVRLSERRKSPVVNVSQGAIVGLALTAERV